MDVVDRPVTNSATTKNPLGSSEAVAAVVILAAGSGTRMKSAQPKVLLEVGGRPLLDYSLTAAQVLGPQRIMVVVGHEREQVLQHINVHASHVETATQNQCRGTADALSEALAELGDVTGEIVVTYGDLPMITGETLQKMVHQHREASSHVTVLTAYLDSPAGYGRIVRDENDRVHKIVQHGDADETELAIREVGGGAFVFDVSTVRDCLAKVTPSGTGEIYLTDVVSIAAQAGKLVNACVVEDSWQAVSVENRVHLAEVNKELNRRTCQHWMLEGVTIIDPDTTWIHTTVDLAPDVTLLPGTMLEGATSIATGAVIGPETLLRDCEVGERAVITRSHCLLAVVGPDVTAGPYVYMRPGTELAERAHLGTFVETKNAKIGPGAKVPHLCYCGDAFVDEGANIGAGTIFANYDGVKKWPTHVGKYGFVGSNSVLVAPVDIGDGAYAAAGSTVTQDIPAGSIGIARGRQHNAEEWVSKRRSGSKSALAAEASQGTVHPAVSEARAKQQEQADAPSSNKESK